MRPKTIIMLIMAVLLAIMLFQLTYASDTTRVFAGIPEKDMIYAAIAITFILGYMTGRPRKQRALGHFNHDNADSMHTDTLSDEDREYIN
jgi:hypothetical protein